MSYAQLKAFHAVALEGSIQKAAGRLNLTQPAISIHLKSLETDSGKALFRKNGHMLELTSDGQILLNMTTRMFRAESDAQMLLSSRHDSYQGSLIIGADGPHVALDLIAEFRRTDPAVRIETIFSNAEETWFNLLNLKIDVAILAGSPDHPRVQKTRVCEQDMVALISARHEWYERDCISLEQLISHPLIFREQGSSTQRKLEEALTDQGVAVEPVLVLGSREAMYEAVVRNMGIGFLYEREVGHDPRVKALPIKGLDRINQDEVACLKSGHRSRHVETLLACVASIAVG